MKKINATPFPPNGSISNHYPARSLKSLTNTAALIAACLFVKLADAQPGGGFGGGHGGGFGTGTGPGGVNSIGGGADVHSGSRGKGNMSSKAGNIMFFTMLGVMCAIPLCYWQRKRIVNAYYDVIYGITCTLPEQLSACGTALKNKIKNLRRTQPPTNNAGIEIPNFQQ